MVKAELLIDNCSLNIGTAFGLAKNARWPLTGHFLFSAMKLLYSVLLTAALALATALSSYANGPLTVVSFSAERGLPFRLTLDGRTAPGLAPQVRLDNLAPGRHLVELGLDAGPVGRRPVRVRAAVWLEEGLETSFVLTERPGSGWQLRQVGTAALPGYGYEGQGNTYADGGEYPAPGGSGGANPPYPPIVSGPAGPAYPAAPGAGYLRPLSPQDADDLTEALRRCPFDDRRLLLLRQALSNSYLRSSELAAMLKTMSFSDSQKEVARFGYPHLADPQNFYRVCEAFTFSTDANAVLKELGLTR